MALKTGFRVTTLLFLFSIITNSASYTALDWAHVTLQFGVCGMYTFTLCCTKCSLEHVVLHAGCMPQQ